MAARGRTAGTTGCAGERPDLAMVSRRIGAELSHPTEHGKPAPAHLQRGEMLERRPHRDRVGVVAIVYQDDVVGQGDELAPKTREDYPGCAFRHLVDRKVKHGADRDIVQCRTCYRNGIYLHPAGSEIRNGYIS